MVTAEPGDHIENVAEAVLIRAWSCRTAVFLANGPGKLTKYAGIDKRFDGQSLKRPPVCN